MKAFTFLRPTDAAEATALLTRHAPNARVIAGGQSLLLAMKDRSERPEVLVSVAALPGLSGTWTDRGELVIGSATTYATLAGARLPGWHAEIARMAGDLADRPVRTMGTIGGALCVADARFDMPALVLGVDAALDVLSADGGRTVAAEDFFRSTGGTSLAAHELLTAIRFPDVGRYTTVAFEKFRQRRFDAALASALCAARIDDGVIKDLRITIGATTPVPRVCTDSVADVIGRPAAEIDPAAVAHEVSIEVLPTGSDDLSRYRRELIVTLTSRALARALDVSGS